MNDGVTVRVDEAYDKLLVNSFCLDVNAKANFTGLGDCYEPPSLSLKIVGLTLGAN